ncbi:MAG: YbjN domain-containing protein [Rhodospirillales bacterium]|nr:YbjN domain-containing protein [Rhodospirillales bacterium]
MARLSVLEQSTQDYPLDVVEQVVDALGWRLHRIEDDEMAAEFRGNWCDYSLHFAWAEDIAAIHITCAIDIRIPAYKRTGVYELLALINDRMWLGHFCLWPGEEILMYRHALPLRGAEKLAREQVEDLLEVAASECERFYPAFQYLVWGGKSAADALEAAMIVTVGEA